MDRDGNGKLTPDEVIVVVDKTGQMSEKEALELISCHDLDKDGTIDYSGEKTSQIPSKAVQ